MRRNIEEIEIKEPPLQELNNKRSCVKRSCVTGGGCIIVFILASALILYVAAKPSKKSLNEVPAHFPKDIRDTSTYDKDAIRSMTLISGKAPSRWIEIAAYVPKIILSPLIIALERDYTAPSEKTWTTFIRVIEEPTIDRRDQVIIEWANLGAQPKFVTEYFQKKLQNANFTITVDTDTPGLKQFTFSKDTIDGMFLLTDNPKEDGSDQLFLTIRIPQP